MTDQLTDTHLAWAQDFTGVNLTGRAPGGPAPNSDDNTAPGDGTAPGNGSDTTAPAAPAPAQSAAATQAGGDGTAPGNGFDTTAPAAPAQSTAATQAGGDGTAPGGGSDTTAPAAPAPAQSAAATQAGGDGTAPGNGSDTTAPAAPAQSAAATQAGGDGTAPGGGSDTTAPAAPAPAQSAAATQAGGDGTAPGNGSDTTAPAAPAPGGGPAATASSDAPGGASVVGGPAIVSHSPDPDGPAPDQPAARYDPVPPAATDADTDPADLRMRADKYLRDHNFSAELAEVVPGDHQCNVFLADHLVKKQDVFDAIAKELPDMAKDTVGLWQYVNDAWDTELKTAFVLGGAVPSQTPTTRPMPDGLLKRKLDTQVFWQPAAIQTIGGPAAPADDGWTKDFFDFYGLTPPDGDGGNGACVFNSGPDTIDNVVKTIGAQAELAGYAANDGAAKSMAEGILARHQAASEQGDTVADRAQAKAEADDKAAADAKDPDHKVQIVGAAAVQTALHWELTPSHAPPKPADPHSDTVTQFQFGVNYLDHKENQTGKEFAGQLTLGYNLVTKQFQTLAGGQFVDVMAVWKAVQIQFFTNMAAGTVQKLEGSKLVEGQVQWQAGAQVVVSFGPVQFSIGAGGGGTMTQDSPTTSDPFVQGQASVQLDRPPNLPPPAIPDLDIKELTAMKMDQLLIALEEINAKGQLDNIPNTDPRVAAAIMAVNQDFADSAKQKAFYAFVDKLSSKDDQETIRQYVYRHIGADTPPGSQ